MFPEAIIIESKISLSADPELDVEPFHLEFDEHLRKYVDGEIDELDKEIVEGHVRTCSYCAGMLRDLQEFRERLSIRPPLETVSKRGFFQRLYAAATYRRIGLVFSFLLIFGTGAAIWYLFSSVRDRQLAISDVAVTGTGEEESLNSGVSIPEEPPEISIQRPRGDEPTAIPLKLPAFLGSLRLDPPGVLRGNARIIPIVVTSANGVAVRDSPRLSWKAVKGVDSYEVTLLDADDLRLDGKDGLGGTSWTFPKLTKGRIYKWQVVAERAGPEGETIHIGQGRFYIISPSEEARIDAARDPIERGQALAEAGLVREAADEFRRIRSSDPRFKVARAHMRQLGVAK